MNDRNSNISFGTPRNQISCAVTPGGGEVTPVCGESAAPASPRGGYNDFSEVCQNITDLTPHISSSCKPESEPPTPEAPMLSGTYSDEDLDEKENSNQRQEKTPKVYSNFQRYEKIYLTINVAYTESCFL